jgi:GATA-binding protein
MLNPFHSYKLHGSARPISMKSDVIRKRSRHDARRVGAAAAETPSASPGVSRRNSPVLERSPTLAPDSTTQMTYDYSTEPDYRVSQSELTNALGQDQSQLNNYNQHALFTSLFGFTIFPGPYHPDVLQQQQYTCVNDPLPFASVDTADIETVATPSRIHKRRRMSNDSISEPPSSAASYSSFDGFSSASSATSASQRSSMEFPFSPYPPYNMLRGSESTFWHPPMLPHERSPEFVHPPMLPPDDFTMDYVHPPMAIQDEDSLFSAYLHPPMIPAEDRSPALMSSHLQPHPPMLTNDSMYKGGRNDFFDPAMRSY